MRKTLLLALGLTCLVPVALAADLPEHRFRALMQNSPTPQVKDLEAPFWAKTVPEASGGRITANAIAIDQMAAADQDVLRLLQVGAFDFASFDVSKMAGDDPRFEGCDLAGLTTDMATARKACDAYRPVMAKIMEEQWGAKLLAIGTAPPQIIWCSKPVTGLADLADKKIRVFNKSMIDFVRGIGALPVNISFAEVVPALQQGVVDCAVTSNAVGNSAGWPEVTTHIVPISLGWSINVHAANLDSWNKLDEPSRTFMEAQFRGFEDEFWRFMEAAMADADNCNVGKDPCKLGKPANMIVPVLSDADMKRYQELIETAVVAGWAGRVGPEATGVWNETVGAVLGVTAKAR